MTFIPRWLIASVSLAFGTYLGVLGLFWLPQYPRPELAILAVAIYFVTFMATILGFRGLPIPFLQGLVNLVGAIAAPYLINLQIDQVVAGTYATWYVGAFGCLAAATIVRQQQTMAWLVLGSALLQAIIWAGPNHFFDTGVVGSVCLVLAGQAVSIGLRRAKAEADQFSEVATVSAISMASISATRTARQERIDQTLRGALPMLELIIKKAGRLTSREATEARYLEASMRDEIRGRNLLNDDLRAAIDSARRRGIEVIVLDEGGLDSTSDIERDELLSKVVESLAGVKTGRVTLRSPAGESWRITMAAMRPGQPTPDVWLRI